MNWRGFIQTVIIIIIMIIANLLGTHEAILPATIVIGLIILMFVWLSEADGW